MSKKTGLLTTLRKSSDWFIPTGAVALVFVMLVPLPSFVLDLLLTLSITASVLVLLTFAPVNLPRERRIYRAGQRSRRPGRSGEVPRRRRRSP